MTVAAKPRPVGLSPTQKAMLGLAMFAVLGAAAFVADILAARDGHTPVRGFDQLDDRGAAGDPLAGGASTATMSDPDGDGASPDAGADGPGGEGSHEDALTAIASTTRTPGSGGGSATAVADLTSTGAAT